MVSVKIFCGIKDSSSSRISNGIILILKLIVSKTFKNPEIKIESSKVLRIAQS